MKGIGPLFLGIFGTFAFSWLGMIFIPNMQLGRLEPQIEEEGADVYPMPKSGAAERGRQVYIANGCIYCHTQQVRPIYAGADIERKWGERRSAPRDYIFETRAMLGNMRMGPDLANIGARAPSADETDAAAAPPPAAAPPGAPGDAAAPPAGEAAPAAPAAPPTEGAPAQAAGAAQQPAPAPGASDPAPGEREGGTTPPTPAGTPAEQIAPGQGGPSPAPATRAHTAVAASGPTDPARGGEEDPPQYSAAWHHRHLYNPRSITGDSIMPSFRFLYTKQRIGAQPSADAVRITTAGEVPEGWEIVPTQAARDLVAYLMSLNQSHALPEVRSAGAPAAAAPAAAAPEAAAPAQGQ
jgi:cbb3-type cytochrome oxidase cytochrome c subunit